MSDARIRANHFVIEKVDCKGFEEYRCLVDQKEAEFLGYLK